VLYLFTSYNIFRGKNNRNIYLTDYLNCFS